jgi:hypothetical protein
MLNYDYLGAYSLPDGGDMDVTIINTESSKVKNAQSPNGEECFIVYFKEADKPMILNATNCKTIQTLYSPFIEDWIGKRVTLYSKMVKAFGTKTDALRIRDFAPKDKTIDVSESIKVINSCKTLEELKTLYMSLPTEHSSHRDVKAAKDTMKGVLS